MKIGKTIVELAQEIHRQQQSKKDVLADTRAMRVVPAATEGAGIHLEIGDYETGRNVMAVGVNDLAFRQIGEHCGVPAKYADRMLQAAPALLATNLNHWLHRTPEARMVRTLDGRARAFLSDRYRPLENADLAEAVLPILADLKVQVMSCEITERRLYIKAVDERIEADVPSGRKMGDGTHTIFDTVCPAITISNSEVGAGALSIEGGFFTRACTNMAIFGERSLKRYHVGAKHEMVEGLYHLLSAETRAVSDKAVWMQARDVVKAAFDQAKFDALTDSLRPLAERKITGDVPKVIELASRRFGIGEDEGKSVLRHLIEGGDLTQYGLFNAITRTAEDLPSYDRATEFERIGGQVIELPKHEFERLAIAA